MSFGKNKPLKFQRKNPFQLLLSDDEKVRFETICEKIGISKNDFVRQLLLKKLHEEEIFFGIKQEVEN